MDKKITTIQEAEEIFRHPVVKQALSIWPLAKLVNVVYKEPKPNLTGLMVDEKA